MTPIDCDRLKQLLEEVEYDPTETQYLCEGFHIGFDLGYRGLVNRQDTSDNIPFLIGDVTEMWNKVMDEVEVGRFVGPFKEIPYSINYIQSPIRLVPKDGGKKTRLIFHLSYKFKMAMNWSISGHLRNYVAFNTMIWTLQYITVCSS